MATPVYSSKEPPQYTQHDNGTDIQQQNFEHEQLPAYTHGPNAPRSSTTPISTSASSISDQESDIVLNFPENRPKQNECKVCCQDLFCGGYFGCCTGPANMPNSDRNLMGSIVVVLCCGAGIEAGVS